jgi:hypothetical protein
LFYAPVDLFKIGHVSKGFKSKELKIKKMIFPPGIRA